MQHHTLSSLPTLGQAWPAAELPGALYAGVTTTPDGEVYALVLLPAQGKDLSWPAAMAWAESVGGTLPTRPEAALLFDNCRAAFEPRWHWTCEQYSAHDAWGQYFGAGSQTNYGKSYEGRARAVRRFKLSA